MARLVKKTAQAPHKVGNVDICMCGLSKNQPFCDCSHKKTDSEDSDKLYWYEGDKVEEIETEVNCDCCSGEEGCSGEGCCSDGANRDGCSGHCSEDKVDNKKHSDK